MKKTFYLFIILMFNLAVGQVGNYNINLSGNARHTYDNADSGTLRIASYFNDGSNQDLFVGNFNTSNINVYGNRSFSASKKINYFYFWATRDWNNCIGNPGFCDESESRDRYKYVGYPYNCQIFNSNEFGNNLFGGAMLEAWINITTKPILTIIEPTATILTPTDAVLVQSHTGFASNEYNWQYSFNQSTWVNMPLYNGLPEININATSVLPIEIFQSNVGNKIYFRQYACDVVSNVINFTLSNFSASVQFSLDQLKNGSFMPLSGKYIVSGWVKEDTAQQLETYSNSSINVMIANGNTAPIYNINFKPTGSIIDGWQRVLGIVDIPDVSALAAPTISIELMCGNSLDNCYFDDIRFFPYNGNLKSFVYNEDTQKLMAELDENNYATFYEYDIEGGLVRVKKETEKGVYTIQETRSNSVKN